MKLARVANQVVRVARLLLYLVHLVIGCAAGAVIVIMAVTGLLLVFAPASGGTADPSVETGASSVVAQRLSLQDLVRRLADQRHPDFVDSVTVFADRPGLISATLQSGTVLEADSATGDVREVPGGSADGFFRAVERVHRWLGVRALRPITVLSNVGCFILVASGLCLWIPRRFSYSTVRPLIWFIARARGRARDLNWHQVLGFWSAPVLLVLSGTGILISYRWYDDEPSSVGQEYSQHGDAGGRNEKHKGELDIQLARAQDRHPDWREISLIVLNKPNGNNLGDGFHLAAVAVKTPAREWVTKLHVGDVAGIFGRATAAVGCLAACILTWTGLAVTVRRFRRKRPRRSPDTGPP
jgi:uncharacterized iron-regulated membrane protein